MKVVSSIKVEKFEILEAKVLSSQLVTDLSFTNDRFCYVKQKLLFLSIPIFLFPQNFYYISYTDDLSIHHAIFITNKNNKNVFLSRLGRNYYLACAFFMLLSKNAGSLGQWAGIYHTVSMNPIWELASDNCRYHYKHIFFARLSCRILTFKGPTPQNG